jgi:hypothetical protein
MQTYTADLSDEILGLLESFTDNPRWAQQQLRALQNKDRKLFLFHAVGPLKYVNDGAPWLFLISLLLQDGGLQKALMEPTMFTVEEAAMVARVARKVDPSLEVRLGRFVQESLRTQAAAENVVKDAARMMDILALVSNPQRLLPMLSQLSQHSDSFIRSKVTLLQGRIQQNPRVARTRLGDEDPRVRANAIEAIWGATDSESIALFQEAAFDSNRRVSMNALYGLYMAGHMEILPLVHAKALDIDQHTAHSVLWMMGEAGDPRFLPLISNLLPTSKDRFRSGLLKAATRTRQRRDKLLAITPLELFCAVATTQPNGLTAIPFAVVNAAREVLAQPAFAACSFNISEGPYPIEILHLERREPADTVIMGMLMPRRWPTNEGVSSQLHEGVKRIVGLKRRGDRAAILKYNGPVQQEMPPAEGSSSGSAKPNFTVLAENLMEVQLPSQQEAGLPGNCVEGIRRMMNEMLSLQGSKHIIWLASPEGLEDLGDVEVLRRELFQARTTLHAVLPPSASETLKKAALQLTMGTEGYCHVARDEDSYSAAVAGSFAMVLSGHRLRYRVGRKGPCGDIQMQLYAGEGAANTTLQLTMLDASQEAEVKAAEPVPEAATA